MSFAEDQHPVGDLRPDGVTNDTTSTATANTVVRQTPSGGVKVSPNSTDTISVSAGTANVQDVTGDPAAAARSILGGQGFNVNEVGQLGRRGGRSVRGRRMASQPELADETSPSPAAGSPGRAD